MSYNQEFFEKYRNYLLEPTVRMVHDNMFRYFWRLPYNNYFSVVDLGCGLCREFQTYGSYERYIGVDKLVEDSPTTIKADYLTYQIPKTQNAFVSLFSTECCLPVEEKYAFYRKTFSENRNITFGLVSGFYYKSKIGEEKVEEAGGLVSYQTIEDQKKYQCKEFIEFRSIVDVPSELFGPDVAEVWKFFMR